MYFVVEKKKRCENMQTTEIDHLAAPRLKMLFSYSGIRPRNRKKRDIFQTAHRE